MTMATMTVKVWKAEWSGNGEKSGGCDKETDEETPILTFCIYSSIKFWSSQETLLLYKIEDTSLSRHKHGKNELLLTNHTQRTKQTSCLIIIKSYIPGTHVCNLFYIYTSFYSVSLFYVKSCSVTNSHCTATKEKWMHRMSCALQP